MPSRVLLQAVELQNQVELQQKVESISTMPVVPLWCGTVTGWQRASGSLPCSLQALLAGLVAALRPALTASSDCLPPGVHGRGE